MKNATHQGNIMRPTKAQGTLGETQGSPEILYSNHPFSRRTLNGTEQETARQNGVTATYLVETGGDPNKPITEECWIEVLPLTRGTRLNIAFADDVDDNGVNYRLFCGENK